MTADSTDKQRKTRAYFDAHSTFWHDVYDAPTYAGYRLRKQRDYVLQAVQKNVPVSGQILDLGCGAGVVAISLAQAGYRVSGVDIAPKMIAIAQRLAQEQSINVDFRVGFAENLAYPDAHFNALVALGLLANVPDDERALQEIGRVLQPGGHLWVTMPNALALDIWLALPKSLGILLGHTRLRRPLRRLANGLRRLVGRTPKEIDSLRYGKAMTIAATKRLLKRHGFCNVDAQALSFGPMMPFGLPLFSDARSIQASEHFLDSAKRAPILKQLASLTIYHAQKRETG